jgi:hypothetical protein
MKHTWQAVHGGTHSCKICDFLVGQHPKPFHIFGENGCAPVVLKIEVVVKQLKPKLCTFIKRMLSFLPVRHKHCKESIELFGVVRMNKMT